MTKDEKIEKMLNGELSSDNPFIQYLIEEIAKGRASLHKVQLAKAQHTKELEEMKVNSVRIQGALGKHIDDLNVWVDRVDREKRESGEDAIEAIEKPPIAAVPND